MYGDAEAQDLDEYAAYIVNDEWYAVRKLKYLIFQLEETPEAGRQHLQMLACFKNQVTARTAQRRLGLPGAHCEPLRGTHQQAADYCRKTDTRIDGPYEWGAMPIQGKRTDLDDLREAIEHGDLSELELIQQHFGAMTRAGQTYRRWMTLKKAKDAMDRYVPDAIDLLQWQKDLLKILTDEKPLRRRIFWVWSTTSKTGKSTFMQYLRDNCNACVGLWNLNNFLYMYQTSLAEIILFNLPRHQGLDEKKLACLEALSDQGRLPCGKYEGREVLVVAHVIVFANVPPPPVLPDRIKEIHLDEFPILERADALLGADLLMALDAPCNMLPPVELNLVCLEDPLPASSELSDADTIVFMP